jgi:hypothetical protein
MSDYSILISLSNIGENDKIEKYDQKKSAITAQSVKWQKLGLVSNYVGHSCIFPGYGA